MLKGNSVNKMNFYCITKLTSCPDWADNISLRVVVKVPIRSWEPSESQSLQEIWKKKWNLLWRIQYITYMYTFCSSVLAKQLQEHYPGCQRFSKRGAAKRQLAKRQGQKREGEKRWGSLWFSATVDLNHTWHQYIWTRSDPVSWLEESYRLVYSDWLLLTDRCVVTGCLLINLMI